MPPLGRIGKICKTWRLGEGRCVAVYGQLKEMLGTQAFLPAVRWAGLLCHMPLPWSTGLPPAQSTRTRNHVLEQSMLGRSSFNIRISNQIEEAQTRVRDGLCDRPKANMGELCVYSLKQIHLKVHSAILGSSSASQWLFLFLFHPGVFFWGI